MAKWETGRIWPSSWSSRRWKCWKAKVDEAFAARYCISNYVRGMQLMSIIGKEQVVLYRGVLRPLVDTPDGSYDIEATQMIPPLGPESPDFQMQDASFRLLVPEAKKAILVSSVPQAFPLREVATSAIPAVGNLYRSYPLHQVESITSQLLFRTLRTLSTLR